MSERHDKSAEFCTQRVRNAYVKGRVCHACTVSAERGGKAEK